MKNRDVCGVVVLYHPTEDVWDKIATYMTSIDRLYIVDNSDNSTSTLPSTLVNSTVLLSCGTNLGIATALDMALEQASLDGYRWMLTMDQDGSFELSELAHLLACREGVAVDETLLIAPLHIKKSVQSKDACHLKEIEYAMTSGNLVYVDNAKKIGGYDRDLFIDEVDHEFCFRGQVEGFKVLSLTSAYVDHQLGVHYTKGNRQIRLYPPERLYYMMRNFLLLEKRYQQYHPEFFKTRTRFLKQFFYQHLRY